MSRSVTFKFGLFGFACIVLAGLWHFQPLLLGALYPELKSRLLALWSRPIFAIGNVNLTPESIGYVVAYLGLVWFTASTVGRILRSKVLDRTQWDEGQKFLVQRGIGYTIACLGLFVGLNLLGLDLTSLALFSGALGIGIGLGLQTISKNFASGLILLIERPVRVGDRIEINDLLGDIVHIGIRSTWIRTNNNVVMIVPNSEFTDGRVTNWTANDRRVRINVPLGVSYGSDPDGVRRILLEVAASHPDVLNEPPADVIFTGFGESSLDFELRVWTTRQVTTPRVIASELYFAVFKAFKREDIEIPFPQRDLHLRSSSIPLGVSDGPLGTRLWGAFGRDVCRP